MTCIFKFLKIRILSKRESGEGRTHVKNVHEFLMHFVGFKLFFLSSNTLNENFLLKTTKEMEK